MIPLSWIRKCMQVFKVADNVREFIGRSMYKWETELQAGNERLGKVEIKRGILQGESLSPLLFVLTLIPLSLILRKVKAGYDLGRNMGVVNHLFFMDDLKLY